MKKPFTPKRFFLIGGTILIVVGILGITGLFQRISTAVFFHPPHWINWFHLVFGLVVLNIGIYGGKKFHAVVILFPLILGTTIGFIGLIFGDYLAKRFDKPELADNSDHIAHTFVGLFAFWAWTNRREERRKSFERK